MPTPPGDRPRRDDPSVEPPSWDELTSAEQHLLVAALAEKPLWLANVGSGDAVGGIPTVELLTAARHLVAIGLLWFYRLEQGYPDLAAAEVEQLCADDTQWTASHDGDPRYGLYLTDAGETLFPLYGHHEGSAPES